ncbi:winged helix-turn-helix domain-containing protein [Streptomyces sp. NPDC005877]|uniref:ArsR/SmtB family transcription factor n=1 Tax=Streptomyces sp. NPDC005877 TaxID=3155346 RepID=UPI0033D661A3
MTTSRLAARAGISPASASEHATVLRSAGLVGTARDRNAVLHTPAHLTGPCGPGHVRGKCYGPAPSRSPMCRTPRQHRRESGAPCSTTTTTPTSGPRAKDGPPGGVRTGSGPGGPSAPPWPGPWRSPPSPERCCGRTPTIPPRPYAPRRPRPPATPSAPERQRTPPPRPPPPPRYAPPRPRSPPPPSRSRAGPAPPPVPRTPARERAPVQARARAPVPAARRPRATRAAVVYRAGAHLRVRTTRPPAPPPRTSSRWWTSPTPSAPKRVARPSGRTAA